MSDPKMPSGRSVWEVANQLGGYIGPNTPDDLASFLIRESEAAAELAQRIVDLEAREALFSPILAEKEREIERLKLDRDAAQINEAEAVDLMNEYKRLLEAAEAAAIRAEGE